MRTRQTLIFAALVAIACAIGQGCVSRDGARHDTQVREFVERFIRSVNTSDIDAFVSFFAEDATAFFPSHAARLSGARQIRTAVQPTFAQGPRAVPANANDLQIDVSGNLAIASFDAGVGVQHARRTLILRRERETWKIVHLHASNVTDNR